MSLSQLQLKSPQVEQLPQIVALDQLCLGGLWALAGYARELDSPNSCFLALSLPVTPTEDVTASEQIIGCGCFWAILEEAHIILLMVHPEYQGQGLGKLLLCTLLKDAVKRQLERATLEVRASNKSALSLYQKFGFQVAGRRKGYYQATGEDALILWRGDLAEAKFLDDLTLWQQEITALGIRWNQSPR